MAVGDGSGSQLSCRASRDSSGHDTYASEQSAGHDTHASEDSAVSAAAVAGPPGDTADAMAAGV